MTSAPLPPLSPSAALRWGVVGPLVSDVDPTRVLEVGCGMGAFGARFSRRAEYVGVEPDGKSCEIARSRIAPLGGQVIRGTLEDADTGSGFDLVCAFEVLEHQEQDVSALRNWIARGRPGGSVLVSVPAWPERFGPADRWVGHYRRYSPEDLTAVMTEAGCIRVQTVLYGWPLGLVLDRGRHLLAARAGEGGRPDPKQRPGVPAPSLMERTAKSGRLMQPGPRLGAIVGPVTAPFVALQKLRPRSGSGVVALGSLPA